MSAGRLRERVTFSSPRALADENGNEYEGWAEEFTVAARIMPLRGGEDVMAARLAGRQPVVVQVRSSSDTRQIKPHWRAADARKGTILNIRSVANMDERNEFLDLLCEAGVAV